MKLNKIKTFELVPSAPFDFDSTFHKPSHFSSQDNFWEPGTRWQTWHWQGKHLGLKFINQGNKEKPKVRIDVFYGDNLNNTFLDSLIEEIKYSFNLDLNLSEFYKKFKGDKVLGPVIKRWKGARPGHEGGLYEYLMIGIVLQNATVRRSIQMLQNLFEKYGELLQFDGKKMWCFWEPGSFNNVTERELRNLKVGYRAKSIKKIDEQFDQGLIQESVLREKDIVTQKEELIKLYGVGPATVGYILFDVFHQWDYFEHISPWEQKIYSRLFFGKDPENPVPVKRLLEYFKRYIPYQQLAVHYIWEDLWWQRKNKSIPWLEVLIKI